MSFPTHQKQVHLLQRPGMKPIDSSILGNVEVPLSIPEPLPANHVVVKVQLLSLDPSMRPSMNPDRKSYRPPQPLNETMWAGGIGVVVKSSHEGFKEGDKVLSGSLGAQEYAVVNVPQAQQTGYFSKIDPARGIDEKVRVRGREGRWAAC